MLVVSDPQYFADVIHRRRKALGLSLAAVAAGGGPSEPTMVRIESGSTRPLRAPTFKKLDHILRWPEGSARSVYEGGEPLADELRDEAGRRASVARGDLQVAVGTLTALVEAANSIAAAATHYERNGGPLTSAVAELRSALSPLVGRVISAMLSSNSGEGVPAARVAQAVEAFMAQPPDDETPARTAANLERRELYSKLIPSTRSEERTRDAGDESGDPDGDDAS